MRFFRYLTIALIACTGVGLFYLAARTRFIRNNHKGIVVNYNASEGEDLVEELQPGIHIILSPFREFQREVSTQTTITQLSPFPVKTRDNVDANIQADFTFRIRDPKKAFSEVQNFAKTFLETVKGTYSSAIQNLNYREVNTTTISNLAASGGHQEEGHHFDEEKIALSPEHGNAHRFFSQLLTLCERWGVEIINFRIISVEAKHPRVSESLELIATADLKAQAQATAANSQASMLKTLAEGQRDAQRIRVEAAFEAANCIGNNKVALEIYTQENNVRTATALSQGRNHLTLGLGGTGQIGTMFNAMGSSGRDGLYPVEDEAEAHRQQRDMQLVS